jgi:hypothetical protein
MIKLTESAAEKLEHAIGPAHLGRTFVRVVFHGFG